MRLSGEDCTRGTFTQRHLEFYDTETGEGYLPLKHLQNAAKFESIDSLLSEFAVMGFEFGYSVADPLTLVLWEAQFGDFVNGAQIIIDQFVVSAEAKWNQPSGLVLSCPTVLRARGRSTPARVSNAFYSSARKIIFRSAIAPRPRSISTCCAAKCMAVPTGGASANR